MAKESADKPTLATAWLCFSLVAAGTILAVFLAHTLHYTTEVVDDAWISYRYALNLANGQGLTFNAGELVEGSSAPIFVLLIASVLTVFSLDAASLLEVSRAVGVISAVLAILLTYFMAFRVHRRPMLVALFILLGLAANPYMAFWAVNGMETTFHGLLLLAILCALETIQPQRRSQARISKLQSAGITALIIAGVAVICASRPEAPAFAGAYIAYRIADALYARSALWAMYWASAGLAGLALVLGTRFLYFGDFFPNTFYAKIQPLGLWREGGWRYISSFFAPNAAVACLHIIAVIGLGLRFRRDYAVHLILVLGSFTFAYYSGGDWMFNFRFAVAAIPSYILLTVCGLLGWQQWATQRSVLIGNGIAAFLIMGLALHWGQSFMVYKTRPYFVWDPSVAMKHSVLPTNLPGEPIDPLIIYPTELVLDYCADNERVMMPDIGLPAFLIDNDVLDSRGLTDRATAKALYYGSRNLESVPTRYWMAEMKSSLASRPPCIVTLLPEARYPAEVYFLEHLSDGYQKLDDRTYLRASLTKLPDEQRMERWYTAWSRIPRSRHIAYSYINQITPANGLERMCEVYHYYKARPRLYLSFQEKLEDGLRKLDIQPAQCDANLSGV